MNSDKKTLSSASSFRPNPRLRGASVFRILTLNVNGIRSAGTKGLFRWLPKADADVVCLQEVKAHEADIPHAWRFPDDLHGHFHCAQKKGYSGTALYSKKEPLRAVTGFGVPEFDGEGRYVQAEFRNVTVVSVYFPSGSAGPHRQESKYRFLDAFFPQLERLRKEAAAQADKERAQRAEAERQAKEEAGGKASKSGPGCGSPVWVHHRRSARSKPRRMSRE